MFDLVKTIREKNNIPTGKVRYRKFKGRNSKLLNPLSPTACFMAKSKSAVNPARPYFFTE